MDVPDIQDLFLLEDAARPKSDLFQKCLNLLLTDAGAEDLEAVAEAKKKEWKVVLPFKGDPVDMEEFVKRFPGFEYSQRGVFRNGVASLSVTMVCLLDSISAASRVKRMTRSVCFSALLDDLAYVVGNTEDSPFDFYSGDSVYNVFSKHQYETAVMDHTTVCVPVDRWLNLCYSRGVRVVEGCFYYHPAAERGWDLQFDWSKLLVLHNNGEINIGPKNDMNRRLTYTVGQYRTFLDPSSWVGNSKSYGYEIYNYSDGIATYRAVYIGQPSFEVLSFNVPMCSDKDNILITVNSKFLTSSFAPYGKYFEQLAPINHRDHAIEVRRSTFEACVSFLTTLKPNSDITGNAIRYVASRNYIDLVDGAKLVRMPSLNYSDALILSLVCALVSFQLRYELTNESVTIIQKAISVAKHTDDSVYGLFGTLIKCVQLYVSAGLNTVVRESIRTVKGKMESADHIPGVIYDVYIEKTYKVGGVYEPVAAIEPVMPFIDEFNELPEDVDPFISFIGGEVKASAPELEQQDLHEVMFPLDTKLPPHKVRPLEDPVAALQDVYDNLLPGHSTLDVPNVSEQRRVNDLNINAEFVGKVVKNKDVLASENLYQQTALRTAAIPQTKTALADLMLASSKRNWNRPDLQLVTDVYELAEKLVSEFIDNAMVPGAVDVLASKEQNPTRFNAIDYCDWLSTRDERFREALLMSCPNEILELNLEKYQTILKGRVKQKQSPAAQHELPQGQVVIHHDPSTNALFTSVFRTAFNTFDTLLRSNYKSAGRISDSDLSRWLTSMRGRILNSRLVEIDSSKYDKSQGLLAQAIEAVMMRRLGVDAEVLDLFSESYVGSVNSRNLGLAFIIAFQRKSGAADTMFGNLIYNYVSAGRSIGYDKITFMVGKGDDNLIGVTAINPGEASSKMAYVFNLDAKVLLDQVPTFSSGDILVLEDVVVFAPSVPKKVELLGEINARTGDSKFKLTREEVFDRYKSFVDSVSMYALHGVPEAVQSSVRARMRRPEADVVLAVDALLTIAGSFELFSKVVPYP